MKTCSKCKWFELDIDPAFDYDDDYNDGLCHAPIPMIMDDCEIAHETEGSKRAAKCQSYKKHK